MAKYDPLFDFLKQQAEISVSLTFGRVEQIIAARLPNSAFIHEPWWRDRSAGTSHVQASAWLGAGYQVGALDLVDEKVTFVKV